MTGGTWPEGLEARDNYILGALPDEEYGLVLRELEPIGAQPRESVFDPGVPITHIYFPLSSVFSLVTTPGDDTTVVEVATIGREGIVGLPVFLGGTTSPLAAFCQVAGDAARMPAALFRSVLADAAVLHQQLQRFTQATITQLAQNVACNRVHPVEQRAGKWLLMTGDRIGQDRFGLTQEFLGQMLGVGRPTASLTAGALQEAGLIRYRRGVITIIDRPGLGARACGCYRLMRAEFDRLRTPSAPS